MDRFEDTKLRIKEATDLVALIEGYLPLKPRGRYLQALCPFHAENSPSFTVYRDEQFYRCYGCGKTGDVFSWLMERDGLTFREAMEALGERAGISLEGVFGRSGKDAGPPVRASSDALQAVAEFCQRALLAGEGRPAMDYLERRGLAEAIGAWQLGFHPLAGALQRFVHEQGLPAQVLEQAGLLRNGREPFAGRLMFPIVDERGRTVGFGGRIVPGVELPSRDADYKPPKYLNSPESPFFKKRGVLYGLHKAKQAGQRRLVVVEGYTDVIACHLAGFPGAVASLGTAFTRDHVRSIERYAQDGLVLMFDADRAGSQAAERALRELVNSRIRVRIALVGDGAGAEAAKDPADVLLARPGEDEEPVIERRARFADMLDGAEDALAVWFRLLRRRIDFASPPGLEAAARECVALLQLVEEPVQQSGMLEVMARHLAVPTPHLQRLLARLRPARSSRADASAEPPSETPRPVGPISPWQRAEHELLACVLAVPELLAQLDLAELAPQQPLIAELLGWALEARELGRQEGPELVRYLFARASERAELQQMLAAAHERGARMVQPHDVFHGLLAGRHRLRAESVRRQLRAQWQQALTRGDQTEASRLHDELVRRMRQERPRPPAANSSAAGSPPSADRAGGPPVGASAADPPNPPPS